MEKQDIFDSIMSWKLFSPLQPFYKKYKEPLLYLFFGGLTFFLSIGLFWLFTAKMSIPALAANIIDCKSPGSHRGRFSLTPFKTPERFFRPDQHPGSRDGLGVLLPSVAAFSSPA